MTVPVGFVVVPAVRLMVAVKVTDWFTTEVGGVVDVRVTVVASTPTASTSALGPDEGEALPAKFESPR
jgi:hypothetical protein